jgi:DGQHR domain-containing protein
MLSETSRSVNFPVKKIVPPIGKFYIGCISAPDLVSISDFDIQKVRQVDRIDEYLVIQREIDRKRVEEIRQYIQGNDATFPTSVVLAVPKKCVTLELDKTRGGSDYLQMTLSNILKDDPKF